MWQPERRQEETRPGRAWVAWTDVVDISTYVHPTQGLRGKRVDEGELGAGGFWMVLCSAVDCCLDKVVVVTILSFL
jgi:hypothetical protein